MADGIGTTTYSYVPVTGSVALGANHVAQVTGPLNNSTVTFTYDELGRALSRSINGVARTVTYDALGRIPTITDALGTFTYMFLGATSQIASLTYPNGQVTTASYFSNTGDRRLQQIKNLNSHGANLSEFDYTSNAMGDILTLGQTIDANPAVNTTLTYDAADQLTGTTTTGQTYGYTYDIAGNRLTQTVNGTASTAAYNANNELQQVNPALGNDKNYTWDAENRLVGISYAGTGLTTQMSYDGMSRCTQIVERNGTTITSTKRFVWVDRDRCEEHDANDNTVRRFLDQGEQVNGTPYFYTGDQLFSIREMTDSAGALHARYSYDPYGTRTKVSGDLDASRGFTGDYFHAPSGLHLTMYRAYDSQTGRWLSRDPLPGAESSQGPNLFEYVADDPVKNSDPFGTNRTLHFYGHSYITVDTWDSCCKHPIGAKYLDFAPGFGQRSDFRSLDVNDPDVSGQLDGISMTLSSNCKEDALLVQGWEALGTDSNIKYNVYPNNCITLAFTMFTYGLN